MHGPMTITVTDNENEVTVNAGQVLIQLQKDMNEQKKFNQLLVVRLDQQQEYIDNKQEERDQKLMESLQTLQEEGKLKYIANIFPTIHKFKKFFP